MSLRYVTGASIVSTRGERNAPALHTLNDTRSTGEGETINVITTTDRQLGPDSGQVVSSNDMFPHPAAGDLDLTRRRPTNYSARDGHTLFEPGYQFRDPSGPNVDLSEVFITLNGLLLLCSLSITIDCNHVDEIYDTSCLF